MTTLRINNYACTCKSPQYHRPTTSLLKPLTAAWHGP